MNRLDSSDSFYLPPPSSKTLILIIRVHRIVEGVMQSAALFPFYGHAGNQVTHVDHVSQLADILRGFHTLEQVLCLLVQHVQTIPRTFQSEVGTQFPHHSIQESCR